MTPPIPERSGEHHPLPPEAKRRPALRPDSPPPSRTEGIVQAVLAWLDREL